MQNLGPSQRSAPPSGWFVLRARTSLKGLAAGIKCDRSIRELWVIALLGGLAIAIASPPPIWWALTLMAGALAAAIEYLNASIETALDRLHPKHHPIVGRAKDLASAAAFLMNLTALAVLTLALLGG